MHQQTLSQLDGFAKHFLKTALLASIGAGIIGYHAPAETTSSN